MTPENENGKEKTTQEKKTFSFWFWLFTLATVIIIVYYGQLTIASAHTLCLALFMRQLSFVWTEEVERKDIQRQLEELTKRIDVLDPYSEE